MHGPGYSKVVIGPDVADDWERHIDVIAESISNNGGRSCVNASGVWVTSHADRDRRSPGGTAREGDAASGGRPRGGSWRRLPIRPSRSRISAMIEQDLAPAESDGGGASDVSAAVRGADRVVSVHGGTYLLPTIVRCDADHPLANREFLFPFASVVEVSADRCPTASASPSSSPASRTTLSSRPAS